ncbi:MAG: L,D-transpeptidase family protein [Deltaproteobacteria bacterium]|nr:L,D-transpeptidase family protein [Deltaproteobacteria bacterium]
MNFLGLSTRVAVGILGGGLVAGVAVAALTTPAPPRAGETATTTSATPAATTKTEATSPTAAEAKPAVAAPAAEPLATAKSKAELERDATLGALGVRLAAAHTKIHTAGDAASIDEAIAGAIKAAYPKNAGKRKLLTEAYAASGAGHFVRGGHLTGIGAAIVGRVHELEAHALDPKPYDVAGLDAVVGPLGGAEAEDAAADPFEEAVKELLRDPGPFDAARAQRRLEALETLPTTAEGTAAIDRVAERGVGATLRAADAAADVRVAQAVLQLALDFQLVRKAGPFDMRKAEEVFTDGKARKRLAEVVQGVFEAADGAAALKVIDPEHPQYPALLAAYARYREIEASGGCKELPKGWRISEGMKGKEVQRLQERLACEGYYKGEIDGVYEGASVEAMKVYQRHHELEDEGNAYGDTMKSLNIPISYRVKQLGLALQRLRESKVFKFGDVWLRVNIPAFELQLWDHGKIVQRNRVIVGTNRLDDDKAALTQGHLNRTKLFTTTLYEVIVNPTWILPSRVENGELKGKLAEDPEYLEKKNIKKVKLGNGNEVYVQGVGDDNVLGKVKFLLKGTNAIYLHDTDKRTLFRKQRRDFSHGCIRVDQAVEFARMILLRDGWDEKEVDRALGMKSTQRGMELHKPFDLVTEYVTVDVSDEGLPMFLTDVYGYDDDFYDEKLPPSVTARWGSPRLRPRWVPEVSKETVDKWRAAGTPAPRDYDPAKHGK